jgi:hypothetical protein
VNTLDEVVGRVLRRGYKAGRPPWVGSEEAALDRAVCGLSRCTACRGKGLLYHPFFRAADRSYRVLACCRACGHTRETGEGAPVEEMQEIMPAVPA